MPRTPLPSTWKPAADRWSILKAHILAREERLQEIAADIRTLDDHNEQIVELARSMPAREDVEKYESAGTD